MKEAFYDIVILAGLSLFVYGWWLIYHPAAYILSGIFLVLIGAAKLVK